MIEAKKTYGGQQKRYGDYIQTWEIQTDQEQQEVLDYCLTNLSRRPLPSKSTWETNIRRGGEKEHDMGYYFGGYYTLNKTEGGYRFTITEPYCD
jgi:predicted Fe-S protein YdhL (DUF1289 family)